MYLLTGMNQGCIDSPSSLLSPLSSLFSLRHVFWPEKFQKSSEWGNESESDGEGEGEGEGEENDEEQIVFYSGREEELVSTMTW